MAFPVDLLIQLLTALGIGALIGLEREGSEERDVFAGSRTMPLLGLLGATVQAFYPGLIWIAFALVIAWTVIAYTAKALMGADPGLTTAVAAVLVFVFGALATHPAGGPVVTVVLGTVTLALLSSKTTLHGLARQIDPAERRAMVSFLVLALVILPLLPDRSVAWLAGLNPRFVWLMVVFVSGIELSAYLLMRWMGARGGLGVTGLLGGLVSSTATTVSMAARARGSPPLTAVCAMAAVLASLVMLPRVIVEVLVVNPSLAWSVGVPVAGMAAASGVAVGVLYWRTDQIGRPASDVSNPFHLKNALVFGALFAAILLAAEKASAWFGDAGVYATAILSGLADVDAITLSMSRLALEGTIPSAVASTAIVLAIVSNTVVKAGIAWVMGTRALGRDVSLALGIGVLTGLALLVLV